jgi:hypothetical protein
LGCCRKAAGCEAIGLPFCIKLKLDSNGAFERYKTRLVARGDQQIEGVNYTDAFSPVNRVCGTPYDAQDTCSAHMRFQVMQKNFALLIWYKQWQARSQNGWRT